VGEHAGNRRQFSSKVYEYEKGVTWEVISRGESAPYGWASVELSEPSRVARVPWIREKEGIEHHRRNRSVASGHDALPLVGRPERERNEGGDLADGLGGQNSIG